MLSYAECQGEHKILLQYSVLIVCSDSCLVFMRRAGHGKPVVILETGAGEESTTWKDIIPAVAQFSQVMVYGRAGLGQSGDLPTPRTALYLVNDLHELLRVSQLKRHIFCPGSPTLLGRGSEAYGKIFSS